MSKIDAEILKIDAVICKNIDKFDASERGLLSQNILSQLRNLVEHIALKELANGGDIENTYANIELALTYIKTRGQLRFLVRLHRFLQGVASHYTLDEQNSERLMLKYYEYLVRIKSFLLKKYGLEIFKNIDQFPLNTDPALQEYYEKIVDRISNPTKARKLSPYKDRYYVQKVKPFFVNNEVYYEVTFTIASSKISKFDRVTAFTPLDISEYYAVKFSVIHDSIEVLGKEMPIQIIDNWEVSIRPCELSNFASLFGERARIQSSSAEYKKLMAFLTETRLNLPEIVNFSDEGYQDVRQQVTSGAQITPFFDTLDRSRALIKASSPGSNVISYLLLRLNNQIIKLQRWYERCNLLSDLYLSLGCIPFDKMPFITSLKEHNPKIVDVFECINSTDREHELFARLIKNNTENKAQLYTPLASIDRPREEIEALISNYNAELYYRHTHRRLEIFKDHIYIDGYERDTLGIIEKLKELAASGVGNYTNSVDSWLSSSTYEIDCEDKVDILRSLFADSGVALIYGAAGTGKSTLINHASHFFNESRKLYLANTNPAVDNLRRKVSAANCKFQTISSFISPRNVDTEFDLLVIDECSTVSNADMIKVLRKASFKSLILVGDVFQIESIIFGNWFSVARSFLPDGAVFELTVPWRTSNEKLIEFWGRVRNFEDNIVEHIAKNGYSANLDETIFENLADDEIILCLNYDGLYGINNLNKFLQSNNPNTPIDWGIHTYKIGDPVLFNETERFAPIVYNNLKGRIINIERTEERIRFDVEIEKVINELQAADQNFEFVGSSPNGNSIIRFFVDKHGDTDEDEELLDTIVPFQVAYAVSIHKAQGLEYTSVKIVITNETEEMISHNIFYTAITRAKENLKIYWTPEAEKKVLDNFERIDSGKDVALLSLKLNP